MAYRVLNALFLSTFLMAPAASAQLLDYNEEEEEAKASMPSTYTPRELDSYHFLRVIDTANLAYNPGEAGHNRFDQMQRYLFELSGDEGSGEAAANPPQGRILAVDLGMTRSYNNYVPALPSPPGEDSLLPGEDYNPQFYYLSQANAVRASVTLQPRATLGSWRPVFALDARSGLQSYQGTTELLLRIGADSTFNLGDTALRMSIWGGFENKLVGLLEPVPGGFAAFAAVFPRAKSFTQLSTKAKTLGEGDFYNNSFELHGKHTHSIANNAIILSAGAEYFAGTIDEEYYLSWTGKSEIPFSAGQALDFQSGIMGKIPTMSLLQLEPRLFFGYSQYVWHTEDPFLDGFYKATGPRLNAAGTITIQKLAEFTLSVAQDRYTGAIPRTADWEDVSPPEGTFWSTRISIGAMGRF